MAFNPDQINDLRAPLNRENVKSRSQAGRSLSYLEGWKAIDEANRIFGFDGWERETLDLSLLGEPRLVGDKYRVGYRARVRIRVFAGDRTLVRDGCGFGSGIDKDLDQAHESALKEAETDAMKRGLMTFGNPFGLALYDKEQRNVVDDHEAAPRAAPAPRPTPQLVASTPFDPAAEEDRRAYMVLAETAIHNAEYAPELDQWWRGQSGKMREYGIVKGTPEYDRLAQLAGEVKKRLPASVLAAG
jgi:DNA repair and recombination protein RAD52